VRRRHSGRRAPLRLLCSGTAFVLFLLGGPIPAQEVPQLPSTLPEGEGRDLVQFHCAICHDLNIVRQQRLDERVWNEVLNDMKRFGAVFTDEQRGRILAYLLEHFGP
jgi:mono/diheme cytochrome c family protein